MPAAFLQLDIQNGWMPKGLECGIIWRNGFRLTIKSTEVRNTMKRAKLEDRLEMRRLTTDDTAQYNALLRYAFQVTDKELASLGWKQKEMERSKKPVLKKTESFGWFDGEKLASQISIYPMQMNIFGTMYKIGGVTGVATYPEYTGHGLMSRLIKQALQNMQDNHQSISVLYPYMIPYYRKKGWEIVSDRMTYTIRDTQLPRIHRVDGMVERVDTDNDDIKSVHDQFTAQRHGALKRNELEWEEYWRWEADDVLVAVYYDVNENPTGYLVYYIADDIFRIKELVYVNQDARHGLWNYIAAHFSMIEKVVGYNYTNEPMAFLLEDSEIHEEIEPWMMARIVDFEEFLRQYPFDIISIHDDLHFVVRDPVLECNNGDFSLAWKKNGELIIERGDNGGETIYADIQTLTTMFLGYKRPTYLKRVERLKAGENAVRILEDIIPIEQPYFSDYF